MLAWALGVIALVLVLRVVFGGREGAARLTTPAPEPGPMDPRAEQEILELVQAGRKIEAIKLYREVQPSGLRDAKHAVEALERAARRS